MSGTPELKQNDVLVEYDVIQIFTKEGLRVFYEDADGNSAAATVGNDGSVLDAAGNYNTYYNIHRVQSVLPGYTGWKVKEITTETDAVSDDGGNLWDGYKITLSPYSATAGPSSGGSGTGQGEKGNSNGSGQGEKGNSNGAGFDVGDNICSHSFEWTVVVEPTLYEDGYMQQKCISCQASEGSRITVSSAIVYVDMVVKAIENAQSGAALELDTATWCTMTEKIAQALQKRPDVSLTLHYTYRGQSNTLTIPAGTDLVSLLDENGFAGFWGLAQKIAG